MFFVHLLITSLLISSEIPSDMTWCWIIYILSAQ